MNNETLEKALEQILGLHNTQMKVIEMTEKLNKEKLDKGDPLLQYLFNTVAQLVRQVAKLEDKLDFYLKENTTFMRCEDCDRNLADYPSKVCVSCNAYKEHFDYS